MKNIKKIEIVSVAFVDMGFLVSLIFFVIDFFNGFITFRKTLQLFFMFLFCISATYSLVINRKSFFEKFFNEDGTVKKEYKEYLEKRKKK
ncbi:MAG: hypothetical protein LBI41_04630 [Lactobacillales bacterium]|jgi:hypothetical protein|nr:hypothetical protein [Lactobacillales bacterium]